MLLNQLYCGTSKINKVKLNSFTPIFLPQDSWFKATQATRSQITKIDIVDTCAAPDASTLLETWDASVAQDGGITCYLKNDYSLIIAGNGSGKLMINPDAKAMFSSVNDSDYYSSLTIINGAELLDASQCLDLSYCFNSCDKLTSINVSNWDISRVTTLKFIFMACASLLEIDVSKWNTGNVTDLEGAFQTCLSLESLDLPWNTSKVTNAKRMFLTDTKVGRMKLSSITGLDKWDTHNITNFQSIFGYLNRITSLDLSNWDVSNATDLSYMFSYCESLKEIIGLELWDVHNCKNFMMTFCSCKVLESLPKVENWNTCNATNFSYMFALCSKVDELKLNKWNTSQASNLFGIFGMSSIKTLEINEWDTSNVTNFCMAFYQCRDLTRLNLNNWNTKKCTGASSMTQMFDTMPNLREITFGANFSLKGNGSVANAAILPTPSSEYIPGADGYWYNSDGDQFTSATIPEFTAATYYAINPR